MKRVLLYGLMACLVGAVLGFGSLATAQVKFCFQVQNVAYSDDNVGEDVWPGTGTRTLRGIYVLARKQGTSTWLWGDHVSDGNDSGNPGAGCTPTFTPAGGSTGTWQFAVITWGRLKDNTMYVHDRDTESTVTRWVNDYDVPSSSTYTVSVDTTGFEEIFRVYLAAAEALSKNTAGLTEETVTFRVGPHGMGETPTGYESATQIVWVTTTNNDDEEKFKFIHELGHWVADQASNGELRGVNCSSQSFTPCGAGGTHAITSMEASSCAAGEGFAHYYSALTWNNIGDSNCWYEYWNSTPDLTWDNSPLIDCHNSHTLSSGGNSFTFSEKFMETYCADDWTYLGNPYSDWEGLGNELDWMRTFWDMDKCSTASLGTWFSAWIDPAADWDQVHAYNNLNAKANEGGQLTTIKDCWNSAKITNGIDHPFP